MDILLASLVSAVLFIIGCIHVYWLFGGRGGFLIAVPTRTDTKAPFFKPGRIEIAAVILIFWAASALLLMEAGVIPVIGPSWLPSFAGWSLAVVFLLRAVGEFKTLGFFKSIRNTHFARMDTLYYSPLCLLLCGLTTWMMVIS